MITRAIAVPEWTRAALCAQVDPELWFPEQGSNSRAAKKICAKCPVQVQCREYAVDNLERYGVWGGKSERERRTLVAFRDCVECGGQFKPQANRSRTYCSEDCAKEAHRKQKVVYNANRPSRSAA